MARGLEPNDPVPPSFPFRLSERELDAVLRDMMAALPGFDRYQALLPELKLTLILIGAKERSRRDADRNGRRSLVVAALALLVAVTSLVVGIVLAV